MDVEDTQTESSIRICATKLHEIVSEEDMRPFLKTSFAIGDTIEFKPPAVPPSAHNRSTYYPPPIFFKLTEQGWERVPGKKPGCLTPIAAWAIGGFFMLRMYANHRATEGPRADEVNSDMQMLCVFACFVAGLVVWWWDWQQYKKSLK